MSSSRTEAFAVFGVPAGVSFLLSLSIMGSQVHWQDSGFFLAGIHDLTVLYPHGFVVYQFSAWLWTKVFFFIDFTRAVHLYSAACIAAASGTLSLACLGFLRSRWFAAPTGVAAWASAGAGVLWACGFTVASAGSMAKGYPLLFLVLALLIRKGLQAGLEGRPSDWTVFSALIGLAWAAHPSATLAGPCLVWWTARYGRGLGARGIAARVALAAGVAAIPGLVALPWLAGGDAIRDLGHPAWGPALLEYFTGGRYTGPGYSWGADLDRAQVMLAIAWEELLPVGILVVASGGAALYRSSVPVLGVAALWTLPYLAVTYLFRIEGQMDYWMVAAGLPVVLVASAGLAALGLRFPGRPAVAIAAVSCLGAAWAIGVNFRDLDLRRYSLAEDYGRLHLAPLEPGAILLTARDDVSGSIRYLQSVRGERPDVLSFDWNKLAEVANGRPWFDLALLERHPELKMPDYRGAAARLKAPDEVKWVRAFLEANGSCGRPLYITSLQSPHVLPEGWEATPVGIVWRMAPRNSVQPDSSHFRFAREPEEIKAMYRRARGIEMFPAGDGMEIRYEPYERRLAKALLQARQNLAEWHFRRGGVQNAIRLMESVLAFEPDLPLNPWPIQFLGLCHLGGGDPGRAKALLSLSLERSRSPGIQVVSLIGLGDLARREGREPEATRYFETAAGLPGLSEAHLAEIRSRLAGR